MFRSRRFVRWFVAFVVFVRTVGLIPLAWWPRFPDWPFTLQLGGRTNVGSLLYGPYMRLYRWFQARAERSPRHRLVACEACGKVWAGVQPVYGPTFCDETCERVMYGLAALAHWRTNFPEVRYARACAGGRCIARFEGLDVWLWNALERHGQPTPLSEHVDDNAVAMATAIDHDDLLEGDALPF